MERTLFLFGVPRRILATKLTSTPLVHVTIMIIDIVPSGLDRFTLKLLL